MKHIIIGAGPAGVIAAETIRANKPDDAILLIGDERDPPYARMALPQLLVGDIAESALYLRPDQEHFARLRIERRHARVVRIDAGRRKLVTAEGAALDFDRLLIASGASPFVPLIPGVDAPGVHACGGLEDARRLIRAVQTGTRVLIVGAGYIGCILMEALALRGARVTLVDKKGLRSATMGAVASGIIRRWCEKKGIRVHAPARVVAIDARGRAAACSDASSGAEQAGALYARLSNDESLAADVIVFAAGTRPNIGFLRGSGIQCAQGVLVDASMETNVHGIYAAGDCAESMDSASGRTLIAGAHANAVEQAYCAAHNMSGKPAFQHHARQIDVVETLGLVSASFGCWRGVSGGRWAEINDRRGFRHLRLEFGDDMLIGATSVGVPEYNGALRALIQQRVPLGEWKDRLLKNPARLREAWEACAHQCSGGRIAA